MKTHLSANLYLNKSLTLRLGVRNVDRNGATFISDHMTKPALHLKS